MNEENIKKTLIEVISQILGVEEKEISCARNLQDYGLDSIVGVELIDKINKKYNTKLHKTSVYTYPTINKLVEHISSVLNSGNIDLETEEDKYNENALKNFGQNVVNEKTAEEEGLDVQKMKYMLKKLSEKYGYIPEEVSANCKSLEELAQNVSDYLNVRDMGENGKK